MKKNAHLASSNQSLPCTQLTRLLTNGQVQTMFKTLQSGPFVDFSGHYHVHTTICCNADLSVLTESPGGESVNEPLCYSFTRVVNEPLCYSFTRVVVGKVGCLKSFISKIPSFVNIVDIEANMRL